VYGYPGNKFGLGSTVPQVLPEEALLFGGGGAERALGAFASDIIGGEIGAEDIGAANVGGRIGAGALRTSVLNNAIKESLTDTISSYLKEAGVEDSGNAIASKAADEVTNELVQRGLLTQYVKDVLLNAGGGYAFNTGLAALSGQDTPEELADAGVTGAEAGGFAGAVSPYLNPIIELGLVKSGVPGDIANGIVALGSVPSAAGEVGLPEADLGFRQLATYINNWIPRFGETEAGITEFFAADQAAQNAIQQNPNLLTPQELALAALESAPLAAGLSTVAPLTEGLGLDVLNSGISDLQSRTGLNVRIGSKYYPLAGIKSDITPYGRAVLRSDAVRPLDNTAKEEFLLSEPGTTATRPYLFGRDILVPGERLLTSRSVYRAPELAFAPENRYLTKFFGAPIDVNFGGSRLPLCNS
jgi:hypothetical protein